MKMVKNGEMIEITSEYNADFVRRVKLIGGQWGASKKVWSVPAENEELLIELLRECYGYTPAEEASAGVIKVEYRACDFEKDDVVKIGSSTTAMRPSRDAAVRVMSGSVVVKGQFDSSGGSAKYPSVSADEDVVMRSQMSRVFYDTLPESEKALLTIIDEEAPLAKLLKQRDALLAQLAEVNAKIEELEKE